MFKPFAGLRPGRGCQQYVAAASSSQLDKFMADYVCDGTADQTEIIAACAKVATAGGGRVLLSEGTFTIDNVVGGLGTGVILEGSGWATIVKVAATGTNGNQISVSSNGAIRNMKIDGTKATNAGLTSMVLVYLPNTNSKAENLWVVNSAAYGIFTEATSNNVVVKNCLAEGCANVNFQARSAGSTAPTVFSGCISKTAGIYGFNNDSGMCVFDNCISVSNASHGFVSSATDVVFQACQAISNTGLGFTTSGARTRFQDCFASNNGTTCGSNIPDSSISLSVATPFRTRALVFRPLVVSLHSRVVTQRTTLRGIQSTVHLLRHSGVLFLSEFRYRWSKRRYRRELV